MQAIEILKDEPNVLQLSAPLVVVGNLHGYFDDLREIFELGGPVPNVTYLFLGNERCFVSSLSERIYS